MKRLLFVLLISLEAGSITGQQLPLYSQYLFNRYLINPAVAGSDGYTSINLTAREQWSGVEGAPKSFSLNVQARVLKKGSFVKLKSNDRTVFRPANDGKIGFGGSVYSNTGGLISMSGFRTSYSYHVWLSGARQLSFGLSFNGCFFRIAGERMDMADDNDPLLYSNLRHGIFIPDFSAGVYLLHRSYSLGFSAEQLTGAAVKLFNSAYSEYSLKRHYYFFGTYSIENGSSHELRPSFIVKMSEQLKPQADIGLTYLFKNSFWSGISWRTGSTFVANIGVRSGRLYLGYAIDYSTREIQRISNGTHEITIALKYGDSSRKYRWLDRY